MTEAEDPWIVRVRAYRASLRPAPSSSARSLPDIEHPVGVTWPTGDGDWDRRRKAFAEKGLELEVERVAGALEGERNHVLNQAAFNAFRFVTEDGVLDPGEIEDAFTEAAELAGLDPREIRLTLGSAMRGRLANERENTGMADRDADRVREVPRSVFEAEPEPASEPATDSPDADAYRDFDAGEPATDPLMAAALLTRSALRDLPDPEPLIGEVLDQGTVALLYGPWGSLKTFIAIDWAASVATGRRWQNRLCEQRRVLYVAAEGAYGHKARIEAWEQGWSTSIADDELAILPAPVLLTNVTSVAHLKALISWGGYALGGFSRGAGGGGGAAPHGARDCGEVIEALGSMREATPGGRGVILGVHHTGKDGQRFRGSSAFEGAADTVYKVGREKNGTGVTLDREKRRDGPTEDHHDLRLDLVAGTDSGIVIAFAEAAQAQHTDRSARLLALFVATWPITGVSKSELINVACENGFSRSTAGRALNDLLGHGDLVNQGTPARAFYTLAMRVVAPANQPDPDDDGDDD